MYLLIRQIIIMLFYMLIGLCLYKTGKITKQGSKDMASLLIWLIIPVVIIKSYCVIPNCENTKGLLVSVLASALILFLSIIIARSLFRKNPIEHFSAAFSNAGFIGVPLVQAFLGQEAVFYIASFIAGLNILQWTYGVAVITGEKARITLCQMINPLTLSMAMGIVLFFTGLGAALPETVNGLLSGIAGMNAPLAMLVLGVYLAQADLKSLFVDKKLYLMSFVRLILIPVLSLALLKILGFDRTLAMAVLIASSAPVGANVAVYAQLYQRDYVYASKNVVMSTLCSLFTIPLILAAAETIL